MHTSVHWGTFLSTDVDNWSTYLYDTSARGSIRTWGEQNRRRKSASSARLRFRPTKPSVALRARLPPENPSAWVAIRISRSSFVRKSAWQKRRAKSERKVITVSTKQVTFGTTKINLDQSHKCSETVYDRDKKEERPCRNNSFITVHSSGEPSRGFCRQHARDEWIRMAVEGTKD